MFLNSSMGHPIDIHVINCVSIINVLILFFHYSFPFNESFFSQFCACFATDTEYSEMLSEPAKTGGRLRQNLQIALLLYGYFGKYQVRPLDNDPSTGIVAIIR